MAFKVQSLIAFLFSLCILLSMANEAVAGRSVPKEGADVKQPEWLVDHHDGSVLIPGLGRVLLPPLHGHHGLHKDHDHLYYNPITGTYSSGTGRAPLGHGIIPSTPRSYIPGGDDTLVPNPGFEVPIPGRSGGPPVTGSPVIGSP
ncbi:hypothetical protein L484_022158 [Morus notabilis]|uniref:Cell wall protein n=1 Tax=Morus notabilis TaxID=981085 RepID=W9QZW5_9ROSA|nr:putative cell wall protein [Morus notabilis]EXB62270.1 hypothetical protein L484_022158 [Morus notabilis]